MSNKGADEGQKIIKQEKVFSKNASGPSQSNTKQPRFNMMQSYSRHFCMIGSKCPVNLCKFSDKINNLLCVFHSF